MIKRLDILCKVMAWSLSMALASCSSGQPSSGQPGSLGSPGSQITVAASPVNPPHSSVMAALANELEQEHRAGTFDGMVLITQHDRIILQGAYGYANRAAAIHNSAAALFDMGSIAKTFTAAAVLQLVQQQKIQLTDNIGRFYPAAPEALKPITIVQLLVHQSGLDNFHNASDFEPMDKTEAERRIFAMPLIAPPGQKIAYSNAAYTLLAAIVENVSQQPFREYVRTNLLIPLHLNHTGFYKDQQLAAYQLARGYGGEDAGKTTFDKGLSWALMGAGGMVTTVADLATWSAALRDGAIFPPGATNTVFAKANERWLLGSLAQVDIAGDNIIQMGGSTDYGYTALIQFVPERDFLLVLLLNSHGRKYKNATHHRLSRDHILPILLRDDE